MPNMKAVVLTVLDTKFFKDFLLNVKSKTPQQQAYFHTRAIILIESHEIMLNAKYESSSPYSLGQEDK